MNQRAVTLNMPKTHLTDIEFKDLVYEVRKGFRDNKKQLLKKVSGRFKAGELTGIMGPSGAGKSTLLNILTGFHGLSCLKGTVDYVGSQGKQAFSEYRKESCYIQQEDQLHPLFTVYEVMNMAANLKIGYSLNRKAKDMLIDDILDTLDLTKTKETRCDRLSGGQKKRLSIALELVDNPPVMFLDEPTTGLDSSSSFQCIQMLQTLARGGRTIVCTIHQPSATLYEMFDHIYLLADGRCMFAGSAKNTVAYFSNLGLQCPKYHNPADYMIEVVSKEYGDFNDQLALTSSNDGDKWREVVTVKSEVFTDAIQKHSDDGKAHVLVNPPTEAIRFWILLQRSYIQLYRDWTVTHLKLALHFLVGILLGLLYVDAGTDGSKSLNNVGFFIVTCVYLCYTSMMPAVLKFPQELPVLKKERFNNWYQLRTYYIASLAAGVPVQIFFIFTYVTVSYFLTSQPHDWTRYWMFFAVAALTTFASESFGLVLGATVNPINGTFLGAITTCAMLSFAGFLVLFTHMSPVLYYTSYISYLRYAVHGMVQAIYGNNREKLPCPTYYCHYRVPSTLTDELGMSGDTYWIDVLVLSTYMVILRIIAYFTLKRKLSSTS